MTPWTLIFKKNSKTQKPNLAHSTPVICLCDQSLDLYSHFHKKSLKTPTLVSVPSQLVTKVTDSQFWLSKQSIPLLTITTKPPNFIIQAPSMAIYQIFPFYHFDQTLTKLNIPSQTRTWIFNIKHFQKSSLPQFRNKHLAYM